MSTSHAPKPTISQHDLAAFCKRHDIKKLAFFGSYVRDDFHPESDVDVLVEFKPGTVVGLRILEIEHDLSELLDGRKVEIVNPKYLNVRLREQILLEAEVRYAEG